MVDCFLDKKTVNAEVLHSVLRRQCQRCIRNGSSLTDELIRRIRLDQHDERRIAVISIDPSRRKSGGALLGDRIRMNAIGEWSASSASAAGGGPRVFLPSLAPRPAGR